MITILLFILFTVALLCTNLMAKYKYQRLIQPLNEKVYRLKRLFPGALFMLDLIRYKYKNTYDRSLLMKTSELHGEKNAAYMLSIHFANKLALMLTGIGFLLFIAIFIDKGMDFYVFSIFLVALMFYAPDMELDQKVKERKLSIQIDFPDFLNRLTLLVNAGMSVPPAFERIAMSTKKKTPLYSEVLGLVLDMQSGKSMQQAFEDFARRCRTPEITKFVAVVTQNFKKGGSELVSVLKIQSVECWEMRKNAARRLGEEASTKMLVPLMVMFAAILLIVATPAVLAMYELFGE